MSEDPAKLKEMVTLYKQGLLVNPKDTRKRYQLASAYHKLGELDKAIKEYESARRSKADHFGTRYGLGRAYVEDGQTAEAVAPLKEAVAIKPESNDCQYVLAEVATQVEDVATAADAAVSTTSQAAGELTMTSTKIQHSLQLE